MIMKKHKRCEIDDEGVKMIINYVKGMNEE
jgi:hypothetical protein